MGIDRRMLLRSGAAAAVLAGLALPSAGHAAVVSPETVKAISRSFEDIVSKNQGYFNLARGAVGAITFAAQKPVLTAGGYQLILGLEKKGNIALADVGFVNKKVYEPGSAEFRSDFAGAIVELLAKYGVPVPTVQLH
jgi:hypothetical protein